MAFLKDFVLEKQHNYVTHWFIFFKHNVDLLPYLQDATYETNFGLSKDVSWMSGMTSTFSVYHHLEAEVNKLKLKYTLKLK